MTTARPIRARISRGALLHNYRLAKRLAPDARAWAVIKADAYGHGQWRAVETLREAADGFAVLECENAVALREAGVTQPILLLEGIFSAADARAVAEQRLTTVIHCQEQLELLLATVPHTAPLAIYLKLNTGMNRLGFVAVNLEKARKMLAGVNRLDLTLMTHFAEADGGTRHRRANGALFRAGQWLAGPGQPGQFGGRAALSANARRLGTAGNHALRLQSVRRPERR